MRKLTFASFLARYLKELSANGTSAALKLAKELGSNPRLLEPLCFYAACAMSQTQRDTLFRHATAVAAEFNNRPFLWGGATVLEEHVEQLPTDDPYFKCWNSYVCVRDRHQSELHTKELMHTKIRQLQQRLNVSNYRIYRTLGLNPGNMNAFLTHGDCTKVSLDTARRVLRYLQQDIALQASPHL